MESYLVPRGYGEAEFVEKRSRFIGQVWRVESEEEARSRTSSGRETSCAMATTASPRARRVSLC